MSTLIGPIENENEYAAKKRRRKQETSRLAKKAKRSRPANYIDYNAAVFVKCLSTLADRRLLSTTFLQSELSCQHSKKSKVENRPINRELLNPDVSLLQRTQVLLRG